MQDFREFSALIKCHCIVPIEEMIGWEIENHLQSVVGFSIWSDRYPKAMKKMQFRREFVDQRKCPLLDWVFSIDWVREKAVHSISLYQISALRHLCVEELSMNWWSKWKGSQHFYQHLALMIFDLTWALFIRWADLSIFAGKPNKLGASWPSFNSSQIFLYSYVKISKLILLIIMVHIDFYIQIRGIR